MSCCSLSLSQSSVLSIPGINGKIIDSHLYIEVHVRERDIMTSCGRQTRGSIRRTIYTLLQIIILWENIRRAVVVLPNDRGAQLRRTIRPLRGTKFVNIRGITYPGAKLFNAEKYILADYPFQRAYFT